MILLRIWNGLRSPRAWDVFRAGVDMIPHGAIVSPKIQGGGALDPRITIVTDVRCMGVVNSMHRRFRGQDAPIEPRTAQLTDDEDLVMALTYDATERNVRLRIEDMPLEREVVVAAVKHLVELGLLSLDMPGSTN